MSTTHSTQENGDAPDFHSANGPRVLTDAQIDAMRQPDVHAGDDEVVCYAVARVDGVIDYNDDALGFATGATILYMDPDAQVAFERRYYVNPGEFDGIDAYDVTPIERHEAPTAAMVANFAHVVEQHAGVDEVTA